MSESDALSKLSKDLRCHTPSGFSIDMELLQKASKAANVFASIVNGLGVQLQAFVAKHFKVLAAKQFAINMLILYVLAMPLHVHMSMPR